MLPSPLLPLLLSLLLLLPGSLAEGDNPKPNIGDFMPPGRKFDTRLPTVTIRRDEAVDGKLQLECSAGDEVFAWRHGVRVVGVTRQLTLDANDEAASLGGFNCYACELGCQRVLRKDFYVIDMPQGPNFTVVPMVEGLSKLFCPPSVPESGGLRWQMYDQRVGRMVDKFFSGDALSLRASGRYLKVGREMFMRPFAALPDFTYFRCSAGDGAASEDFRVNARFIPYRQEGLGVDPRLKFEIPARPAITDEAAVPEGLPRGSILHLLCDHPLLGNNPVTWALRRAGEQQYTTDLPEGIFRLNGTKLIVGFFNESTTGIYRCSFTSHANEYVMYKRLVMAWHGTSLQKDSCRIKAGDYVMCCDIPTGSMQSNLTWRITSRWTQQKGPLILTPGSEGGRFRAGEVKIGSQQICLYYRGQRMFDGYRVECLADGVGGAASGCKLLHSDVQAGG